MAVRRRSLNSGGGFSLIEVFIGAAFLVVIALGMTILFTRSMINNESGATFTEITNLARSEMEQMNQLPFNSPELTLDAGSEKSVVLYFSATQKQWLPGTPPGDGSDPATWIRTTSVRQYNNSAWDDGVLAISEALDSATPSEFVHFKEILVQVQAGDRLGILSSGRTVSLRTLISK